MSAQRGGGREPAGPPAERRAPVLDRVTFAVIRRVVPSPWTLVALLLGLAIPPVAAVEWVKHAEPRPARPLAVFVLLAALAPAAVAILGVMRSRRVLAALGEAQEREDLDELRRLRRIIDGDRPPRTAFERAHRLLGDAETRRAFGRWVEARDAFAAIDLEALPEHSRPGVMGQRGLVTAYAGAPEMGLAILDDAIAAAKELDGYARARGWCLRARRATVLSLASRHEEAVEAFEEVLQEDGEDPDVWTEGMFSLARSLHALGAADEALHLLERAASEGTGHFARQAKTVLELARAAPLDDEALGKAIAAIDGRRSDADARS